MPSPTTTVPPTMSAFGNVTSPAGSVHGDGARISGGAPRIAVGVGAARSPDTGALSSVQLGRASKSPPTKDTIASRFMAFPPRCRSERMVHKDHATGVRSQSWIRVVRGRSRPRHFGRLIDALAQPPTLVGIS